MSGRSQRWKHWSQVHTVGQVYLPCTINWVMCWIGLRVSFSCGLTILGFDSILFFFCLGMNSSLCLWLGVSMRFCRCVVSLVVCTRADVPYSRDTHQSNNRGFTLVTHGWAASEFFDACLKSQHDAQWTVSNYQSRPITDFLTRASKFCRRVTNVKTPIDLPPTTCGQDWGGAYEWSSRQYGMRLTWQSRQKQFQSHWTVANNVNKFSFGKEFLFPMANPSVKTNHLEMGTSHHCRGQNIPSVKCHFARHVFWPPHLKLNCHAFAIKRSHSALIDVQ